MSDFAAHLNKILPPLYWGELLRLKRSDALTESQREALQALMDDYQKLTRPALGS